MAKRVKNATGKKNAKQPETIQTNIIGGMGDTNDALVQAPLLQQIVQAPSAKKTFVFIDGSYYCFHRYYSTVRWWNFAFPDIKLENPYDNPDFVAKFRKTFIEGIINIKHKLRISLQNVTTFVGKDCKRERIWRNAIFPEYKGTRPSGTEPRHGQDVFYGGMFFNMVYKDDLFLKGGATALLAYPTLEADDVIALSVKHVLAKYTDCSVYIITSDKDYLQLLEPRVQIYNMMFKNIATFKPRKSVVDEEACEAITETSTNADVISVINPAQELFIKTVMGDKSDNIPSVFNKCGYKTALKYYENPVLFESQLVKENAHDKYALNKRIIDFSEIPHELQTGFIAASEHLL